MSERLLLGEILAEEGVITKEQLHQALLEQKNSKKRLGKVLIELGFVPEALMIHHLSEQISNMLEECEENISYLSKKPHELLSQKIPTHKKVSFIEKEIEEEIYKRLFTGHKLLGAARELFKKGIYEEAVYSTYQAMHHTAQAAHHLSEYHQHPIITKMAWVKSVYTGRSGTSQVERRSIFVEKINREVNPPTKRYTRTIIKAAQTYLDRVEKHFYEVKGIKR
ncbi:MAG: hypothetical protein QME42_02280 [bacterium]|nr:hypothetical protein [bacterium]